MKDSAPAVAARTRVRLLLAGTAVLLAGLAVAIIATSGGGQQRPDIMRFPGQPVRLLAAASG